MESLLAKLDQEEKKYSRELETALAEFSELYQQTADMDTAELNAAHQALRLLRNVKQRSSFDKQMDSGKNVIVQDYRSAHEKEAFYNSEIDADFQIRYNFYAENIVGHWDVYHFSRY